MATLADQTPGSIVKISESGTPVNFLVLCHDYPAQGRTLLLRQDIYDKREFDASTNNYASSDIDTWLTNDYYNMIDATISGQIAGVDIAYTPGGNNSTVTTLNRKIFLLSYTELGFSGSSYAPIEGVSIPYFNSSALRIGYLNGVATIWWLRSPSFEPTGGIWIVNTSGTTYSYYVYALNGCRPAFTLPSDITVLDDGTITPNEPPSPPAWINVPSSAMTFSPISITWSASTDPEGESVSYVLERSVNSQAYTQVYSGAQTQYSDTFSYPCSVIYRVKAVDESGGESGYTESTVVSILMNYSNLVIGGDI